MNTEDLIYNQYKLMTINKLLLGESSKPKKKCGCGVGRCKVPTKIQKIKKTIKEYIDASILLTLMLLATYVIGVAVTFIQEAGK